ncbi:MAG: NUDIX domain-containing protein [Ilumatobacteraceae bacterium]
MNDDDVVIDTVPRAEMRRRNLQHRSVGIAVLGTDGRLLVHRRAEDKDVWPGRWDLAVGGVVSAGEDYATAAVREVGEELGIHDAVDLRLLGTGRYADDDVAAFVHCYAIVHDGPFHFDDGEVVEVRWVDRAGLDELMATATFVPDSIAMLLPFLF